MKNTLKAIAFSAVCLSSTAFAGAGVGMSATSDDVTIYVPIDAGKHFRIEPLFRYGYSETETDYNTEFVANDKIESTNYELGVGLFGRASVVSNVSGYYGARLSYISRELESSSVKYDTSGYRIAPTLGFEYFLTEKFSVGGEAEWYYQSTETDNNENETTQDSSQTGTETRIIARFRF
ncbi:hypothetical protein [Teredinibacter sp. KSP-S5-2]|uniref:hypothetical protein n=1 Tax=Teredinibacter sp. KSP-S5-2 TaxID=3034506 RepID=UPI002934E93E|nr:hypothetical protein [Teredinibacter sp. KSP-S5-2]WNO09179.1 hypothetical protein P5V12_19745 [Teredinibacter sp. KSP-S5-2]